MARVAPKAAARSALVRMGMESLSSLFQGTGGYRGASGSRRALRQWPTLARSADADTLPNLDTLRARSRDLVRNAPIAAGALNTVETSVVGTGLKLQSSIDREVIGLSIEKAREWERLAERIWRVWVRQCDITRQQPFSHLQGMILRSQLESGDLLVVRRFTRRKGDLLSTKLQVIEADRVSTPRGKEQGGPQIFDGVQVDSLDVPVRYWVQNQHPRDVAFFRMRSDEWVSIPAFSSRTGERMALHVFDRNRPGLHRGVPYLAPVIELLKQLERYTEAEIAAAVISAFFTVFVKTDSEIGLANEQTAGGSVSADGTEGVDRPDADIRMGEGAIVDLAPGEDIQTANPSRPNAAFDPFVLAVMRQVGVALELPFEVLVKHFQSSYSASRAAILEAWRFFRRRRNYLVMQLCDPVYEWVISEAVDRGLLAAPGFFDDPIVRQAWLGASWTGDPQGHVQPVQEVKALRARVDGMLISPSQAVAEDSGGDFEMVARQIARDRDFLTDLGLATSPKLEQTVEPKETGAPPKRGQDDPEGEA